MIHPAVIASRNGGHRFTVSPLFVAESCDLSIPGRCRNQGGRTPLAGTGSAMTPLSSGLQRNSIRGRGRSIRLARAPAILFLDEIDSIGSRESFTGDNAGYQ